MGRTKEAIADQIDRLERVKPYVGFSAFRDNHMLAVEAQLNVLRNNLDHGQIYKRYEELTEEDTEKMGLSADVDLETAANDLNRDEGRCDHTLSNALEARNWLDGDSDRLVEEWENMIQKVYVVGFLFTGDGREVVLIQKARPAWQKDRLNGPGGKVNPGELPRDAMIREFRQETQLQDDINWKEYCVTRGVTWRVHYFKAFLPTVSRLVLPMAAHLGEEPVHWRTVESVLWRLSPTLPLQDLHWLIPLATHGHILTVAVTDTSAPARQ